MTNLIYIRDCMDPDAKMFVEYPDGRREEIGGRTITKRTALDPLAENSAPD